MSRVEAPSKRAESRPLFESAPARHPRISAGPQPARAQFAWSPGIACDSHARRSHGSASQDRWQKLARPCETFAEFDSGSALLEKHTVESLGEAPPAATFRTMVTMPSEAADDPILVRSSPESRNEYHANKLCSRWSHRVGSHGQQLKGPG